MATALNGKRGPAHGEDRLENGMQETEKRRPRKSGVKKQPFKPQPLPFPNSSDTPPEETSIDLPPPPSERKIARKRDSTRYVREPALDSPPPPTKRLKQTSAAGSSRAVSGATQAGEPSRTREPERRDRARTMDVDGLRSDLAVDAASAPAASGSRGVPTTPAVDYLSFSTAGRPRPSMPRPTSPPRFSFATPSAPRADSGTDRRARKSLKKDHAKRPGSMYGVQDESLIVDVPERETPMIRKNRELREQQRRSSLGSRGQRASESMDNGDISVPHPDIDTRSFYTHISPNLPEPIRARHLLVYCAKKATDRAVRPESSSGNSRSKSGGKLRTEEGDRLLSDIMEDFMTKLGRGAIDTNVFAQVGAPLVGVPLRPHPRNVANRDTESAMAAVIKACKDEHHQWLSLISRVNRKKQKTLAAVDKARNRLEPDMSTAHEWMQQAFELADGIIAEGDGDLSNMGEFADVEYKVDTLLQSSHTALQYSLQAQRFLDGIFSSLTSDLRARDEPAVLSTTQADSEQPEHASLLTTSAAPRSKGKGKTTDPIHLLRALAAAEAAPRPPSATESASTELDKRARDAPVAATVAPAKRAAVTPARTGLGASTSRRALLSKSTSATSGT